MEREISCADSIRYHCGPFWLLPIGQTERIGQWLRNPEHKWKMRMPSFFVSPLRLAVIDHLWNR